MGTNLQLRFSGAQAVGCGSFHCDDSNQLRIFHLQPLLKIPQELGEVFVAASCFLEQICLQGCTAQGVRGENSQLTPCPGNSTVSRGVGTRVPRQRRERPEGTRNVSTPRGCIWRPGTRVTGPSLVAQWRSPSSLTGMVMLVMILSPLLSPSGRTAIYLACKSVRLSPHSHTLVASCTPRRGLSASGSGCARLCSPAG